MARTERVSYYIVAWQAALMLLAGAVSVFASVAGYLMLGGGELLLQQALISNIPEASPTFKNIELDWAASKLVVHGLRGEKLTAPKITVSGLDVERCEVHLDLWPWQWPPRIDSVHLHGLRRMEIDLEPGFLQAPQARIKSAPPFPIHFHEATADVKIGDYPRLRLEDCRGELKKGVSGEVTGQFSLARLNGKPFDLTFESHSGNRWVTSGSNLEIDTKILRAPSGPVQEAPFDPVERLLRALFSGDSAAQGTISSLRVTVEPAVTGVRSFSCEGELAYRDISLRLPPHGVPAATAMPTFMNWMFFGRKSIWPVWLMPDEIVTGTEGRLSFHMHDHNLEFSCDEGPGSGFTIRAGGEKFGPLESLKGSLVTDEEYRPRKVVLRGFLGSQLACEASMQRTAQGQRTFDLTVQPRVAGVDAAQIQNIPLWRFHSRVEDLSELPRGQDEATLVRFAVEFSSQDFPVSPLLPPGVRDVKGRLFVSGRYTAERTLWLDDVNWKKGALRYGGPETLLPRPKLYGELFAGLERMWGGASSEWWLQDLDVTGKAKVEFDALNNFKGFWALDWKIHSANVTYKDTATNLGAESIEVQGNYHPQGEKKRALFLIAGPKSGDRDFKWAFILEGDAGEKGLQEIRFIEKDVPVKLHPQRDNLPSDYRHGIFNKTVTRTTVVNVSDGKLERVVRP